MKSMEKLVYLFAFVCISFFASSYSSAQNCPTGEIKDCNGYCVPMEWLMDEICDEQIREYPEGSGYYVDFNCEDFMCDLFACEGCGNTCPAGFVPDCNGNCIPPIYIQDGICDMGQRFYKGVPVDFSCQFFGCDMGDCAGSCWDDMGMDGLDDIGACCLVAECSEMTRGECWTLGYTFIGSNTMCLPETCGCGEGWVADCNGECVLLWDIGGGYCSNGELVDYGDGPFELNLDCLELACGLSGCVGNCPGGCCTGADCITVTYYDCVEIGGLFLGSYAECDLAGCVSEQQPIQLPDTELYWSGKLGEVNDFPQWIISEEDLLIAGAMDNSNDDWKTAICVFRYNETEDEWEEEALLVPPDGRSEGNHASYTTDGHRIAVTSAMAIDEKLGIFRKVIDIFAFDGSNWLHEQTIDDSESTNEHNYQWGQSLDILGDVLVVGEPIHNFQADTNYGAAHIYHYDVNTGWTYDSILAPWGDPPFPDGDDPYLGLSVALSDSVVAVGSHNSILLYDISGESPQPLQHIRDTGGNFHPQHRSIDFDNNRLMTHVTVDDFSDVGSAGSRIYEFDGFDWVVEAELVPFDIASGTDRAGYIVDLQGDRAMITSPHDNDLGHRTGSAYIWEFDQSADGGDGEWIFKSKLWSNRAVGGDEFGIGGALHGSNAYLTGIVENPTGGGIKVFWPRGIAWTNPLGGNLSDASNWDPIMPITSDSVSFSLRSQTPILVDQVDPDFPFSQMFIGPGSYSFDLQGVDRTVGAGQKVITMQGVPGIIAELKIRGGVLQVDGEVNNGGNDLPGKMALVSDDVGVMGGIHIDGFYMQHEAGELLIELNTGRPAPAQITSTPPLLNGVLELVLDDDYVPQDGHIIPVISTEFVSESSGQFSVVLISDPLPEGLYIKLNYIDEPAEGKNGGTIYAEVDSLVNLFGYGEPTSGEVDGLATDIVLADFGSATGIPDGFDDIAVTTTNAVHLFLSDGQGGIASQTTLTNSALFNSLSAIDAGDLNGDGYIDLAVVDASRNIFIPIYNDLNNIASFTVGDPENTGPNPSDILLLNTDTDADEDVIIVCTGYSLTDGELQFYDSTPALTGAFVNTGFLASPGNPKKIVPGDVNHDKDLFQLFVSFESDNDVGEVVGIPEPMARATNWNYGAFTTVAIGPKEILSGDINGDALIDVIVSCEDSDVICVMTGKIDGSLASPLQLLVGAGPTDIELVDFDNDGDEDIAVIATDSGTQVRGVRMFRNDTSNNGGNLMFALDVSYDVGANPILVAKGDIDGNAQDDLVTIFQSASFRDQTQNMQIRENESASLCDSDFDGDGEVDVADLLTLIAAWEAVGSNPEDLNDDQIVNVADLLLLIAAWGPC